MYFFRNFNQLSLGGTSEKKNLSFPPRILFFDLGSCRGEPVLQALAEDRNSSWYSLLLDWVHQVPLNFTALSKSGSETRMKEKLRKFGPLGLNTLYEGVDLKMSRSPQEID